MLALLLLPLFVNVTHIVSGYISYTVDSQNRRTHHFTQIIYTIRASSAEDPVAYVNMGDGNIVEAPQMGVKLTYDLVVPKEGTEDGGGTNISGYAFPKGFTIDKSGEWLW